VKAPELRFTTPTWTPDPPATELESLWMYTTALPLSTLLVKLQPPVVGQKVVVCRNAEPLLSESALMASMLMKSSSLAETM